MGSLKATPWVAKLDGGAICQYCQRQYDANARTIEQQHHKHCAWLEAHRDDPNFTWESSFTKATKTLLQE